MPTPYSLYATSWPVNDKISIMVPKVGDILQQEDDYYSIVSMLTAMPIDMMVQLDDIGVDFTTINEYDLFLLLFPAIQRMDTSLVFGGLNLSKFQTAVNMDNNQVVVVDYETGISIDRLIHNQIACMLRKMHFLERNNRKPGNDEGKSYMIQRAREKARRNRKKQLDSQLEELIVGLVCAPGFPYGYEGIRELSIYQFNRSLRQINHKIGYDNRMHGIYAGTINAKELSEDDLTWLCKK